MPVFYFAFMIVAGAIFALVVHMHPDLAEATLPPMVWLLALALVYQIAQKYTPALRLTALTPMQRFLGFFAGALLYFLLMRFA